MNTTGRLFRVGLTGTSRGPGVAAWIEGCPPGLALREEHFAGELARRRGGKPGTTSRVEPDTPRILSGVHEGHTTGQPLLIWMENRDVVDDGHDPVIHPRPGHVDLVANHRYRGFQDPRGGGAFSGRLTACLVVAGVVARRLIPDVTIRAVLVRAGGSEDVHEAIRAASEEGDSLGGLLECRIEGVPMGWGEPLMDPLDARLAQVCLCIPGVRAFEIGAGFSLADMRGSEANDPLLDADGTTASNHAGGINGGLSNGNPIVFRIATRPTPSIRKEQRTVDLRTGQPTTLRLEGRHDACFALRLPAVVEAAAAVVLADFALLARSYAVG